MHDFQHSALLPQVHPQSRARQYTAQIHEPNRECRFGRAPQLHRCWVASERDVATVRDDHDAVVVDVSRTGTRHRKAKHCTLRMRNPVCRKAFQQDLEGIHVGTAGIHVDKHHAVCMRAIQDLPRKHFGCRKNKDQASIGSRCGRGPLSIVSSVFRRMKRMACERLKRDQQRAALVRWRGAPCPLRERLLAAATKGNTYRKNWILRLRQRIMATLTRCTDFSSRA